MNKNVSPGHPVNRRPIPPLSHWSDAELRSYIRGSYGENLEDHSDIIWEVFRRWERCMVSTEESTK